MVQLKELRTNDRNPRDNEIAAERPGPFFVANFSGGNNAN